MLLLSRKCFKLPKGGRLLDSYKKAVTSERFIVAAILFAIFLGLLLYTLDWPPRAATMPRALCTIALLLLTNEMVSTFRSAGREPSAEEKASRRIPWQVIAAFLAIGVVVPLTMAIGLAPAVGIMGAGLTLIYGERRWWVILLIGAVAFLLMYFLFGKVFGLPMEF